MTPANPRCSFFEPGLTAAGGPVTSVPVRRNREAQPSWGISLLPVRGAFDRVFILGGNFFHPYRMPLPFRSMRHRPDSRLKCNHCGGYQICRIGKLGEV